MPTVCQDLASARRHAPSVERCSTTVKRGQMADTAPLARVIIAGNPTLLPSTRLQHANLQDSATNTMAGRELKTVFGGGPIGEGKDFPDVFAIEELYKLLREGGCSIIDTSRLYSNSEEWIGKTQGGDQFVIDSKTPGGFIAGGSDSAAILRHAKETVERLGVRNVSDW